MIQPRPLFSWLFVTPERYIEVRVVLHRRPIRFKATDRYVLMGVGLFGITVGLREVTHQVTHQAELSEKEKRVHLKLTDGGVTPLENGHARTRTVDLCCVKVLSRGA